MGLDERYPDSAILKFRPDPNLDRFWNTPPQPERRSPFLAHMLSLMGDWKTCSVWRHMGSWPAKAEPRRMNDCVEFQILSGLGLPMGTADVIEFDRAEIVGLVTLLFSTTVFGWSVGEDLYVVPDHGQYIIQTDHHDAVHVSFRDEQRLQRFIDGMKEKKFNLPDHIPDPTFKTPDWMKKD